MLVEKNQNTMRCIVNRLHEGQREENEVKREKSRDLERPRELWLKEGPRGTGASGVECRFTTAYSPRRSDVKCQKKLNDAPLSH